MTVFRFLEKGFVQKTTNHYYCGLFSHSDNRYQRRFADAFEQTGRRSNQSGSRESAEKRQCPTHFREQLSHMLDNVHPNIRTSLRPLCPLQFRSRHQRTAHSQFHPDTATPRTRVGISATSYMAGVHRVLYSVRRDLLAHKTR